MQIVTRIVSLIASATEIVCALGLRSFLVGRSHECDYPSDVLSLPQCTSPKFPTDGTSYEIDQRVKQILQESLSVYRVDAQMLDELQPTHIITQSQCEVCAVSLKDVEAAACQLISSAPRIVSLNPNTLEDVWTDIRQVGEALAVPERAEALISQSKQRLGWLMRASHPPRARLAFIEWIDPLMAGGNWMPTLIELAGGKNVFGEAGKHCAPLQWQEFKENDPEIIVVAPCGFDISRTLDEMPALAAQPGWNRLQAVKNQQVFVADGNQFFNRPGPRLVDSAEILGKILHGKEPDGSFVRYTQA